MRKRALIKALASLFIVCLSLCFTVACGIEIEISSPEPHIHAFVLYIDDATCTEDGSKTFNCSCGHTYTERIPALGHTEVIDNAISPTCVNTGLTEGRHCEVCGEVLIVQEVISELGHDFGKIYHFDEKNHWSECTICSENNENSAHEYEWEIILEPTDNEVGEKLGVCICGYEKLQKIPELSHVHNHIYSVTEPTCTEEGFTTYLCDCGDSYVADYVTATGHTEVVDSAVDCSCISTGLTEGKHCEVCGEILVKQEEVAIIEHNFVDDKCTACDMLVYEYFTFDMVGDGNYCIKPKDINNLPKSLVLPASYNGMHITHIADEAFLGCTSLISVVIPDSVTEIGDCAFYGCESLSSITIGRGVTRIQNMFKGCSSLSSIIIGDGVIFIGANEFQGTSLYNNEQNWEDGVLYIGNYLIKAQTSISGAYSINDGTRVIAENAFEECDLLTSIEIPDSVAVIGNYAFGSCSLLASIEIGKGVRYIENTSFKATAFYNNNLNWEDNVLYIGNYLVQAKESLSGYYSVKEGTRAIAGGAFKDCNLLTAIKLPNSVVSVYDDAFLRCRLLTSIIIGNSIEEIGFNSFAGCVLLNGVYFQGTQNDWNKIDIDSNNQYLTNATRYYYSESQPSEEGNFWHYDENGEIVIW